MCMIIGLGSLSSKGLMFWICFVSCYLAILLPCYLALLFVLFPNYVIRFHRSPSFNSGSNECSHTVLAISLNLER